MSLFKLVQLHLLHSVMNLFAACDWGFPDYAHLFFKYILLTKHLSYFHAVVQTNMSLNSPMYHHEEKSNKINYYIYT